MGIVVTAVLLALTAVWCYFDRDTYPAYPPAPASYNVLTAEHLHAESALPLNAKARGGP